MVDSAPVKSFSQLVRKKYISYQRSIINYESYGNGLRIRLCLRLDPWELQIPQFPYYSNDVCAEKVRKISLKGNRGNIFYQ